MSRKRVPKYALHRPTGQARVRVNGHLFFTASDNAHGNELWQYIPTIAPVIGAFDTAITYTENGAGLPLDSNATVTDVDSANFDTGELKVQPTNNAESTDRLEIRNQGVGAGKIGVSGANVTFGGVVIGTFIGGTGPTALLVTLNASATPAAVQSFLRNVTYRSTSDNPSIAPRTVRATVTDGDGGTSNEPTKSINVKAVSIAPVIAGFDPAITYTENGAGLLLDTDATVTDTDSANFDTGKLTVKLISGGQSTDRLEIRNQGVAAGQIGVNGVNVTFSGVTIGTFTGGAGTATLVVTLNAGATPAVTQSLLRNVTYHSLSENPSTAARTVRVTLTDGDGGTSNLPTKTINVTAVNDAPVIGAFDTAISYTANGAAVVLDTNATVTDTDSANFDTGTLTINLTANAETTDILKIRNQGIAAGQIGVSGSNVTFAGTIIGTFTGGTNLTPLVVTLNVNATSTAVRSLLRNITFRSISPTPSTLARTVQVTLTDGDNATSNLPTKLINVVVSIEC